MSDLKDFKLHIQRWILEWHEDAKAKDSKSQFTLNTAYKSLINGSDPIYSGRDAKKLKGIGDKLAARIDIKIGQWYKDNNTPRPFIVQNVIVNAVNIKPKKAYVPKYRSCAFGILVGMYKSSQSNFTKSDLIQECQQFTDSILEGTSSSSSTLSTAVKTLITRELLESYGRPAKYSLTDLGIEISAKLSLNLDKIAGNLKANDAPPIETVSSPIESIDLANSFFIPSYNPIMNKPPNDVIDLCSTSSVVEETKLMDLSQNSLTNDIINDIEVIDISDELDASIPLKVLSEYKIKLIIDNRENLGGFRLDSLESKLHDLGISVEMAPLRLGDALWVACSLNGRIKVVLDYIIERKTSCDLISSIKDKRYLEQKGRLQEMQMKVFYILEESQNQQQDRDRFGVEALETAFVQILDNGFIPIRTTGPRHTLAYLHTLTKQITAKYTAGIYYVEARSIEDKSFYRNMRNYKVDKYSSKLVIGLDNDIPWNLTLDAFQGVSDKSEHLMIKDISRLFLTAVKGVTPIKAELLIKRFKTFCNMHREILSAPEPGKLLTEGFFSSLNDIDHKDVNIELYSRIIKKYKYVPTRLVLGPVVCQRLINFIENTTS
eukprot:NODE_46_length_27655_cov_0.671796.p5 type:complete len:604 gc:universal NODE_46_length_27655_cov_0.671796:14610-12799(-)